MKIVPEVKRKTIEFRIRIKEKFPFEPFLLMIGEKYGKQ
jgi:hypothetical protein